MGLLGKIFSAGDRAKRNLLDFVQNPVESVQQAVGHVNDRARAFNELNDAALAETNASGRFNMGAPATSKLAQTLADAYNPIAMTVYHGSPHLFSRFDASKIGTGEGAQAYGHGLYVAESPDVAKSYGLVDIGKNKDFRSVSYGGKTYPQTDPMAHSLFEVTTKGRAPVIRSLEDQVERLSRIQPKMADKLQEKIAFLKSVRPDDVKIDGGNLYKIDLPDEQIAKMLDWDKPLSQQPASARAAIKGIVDSEELYRGRYAPRFLDSRTTAGEAVGIFNEALGDPVTVSNYLRDAGIPGIRYLDGGSRGVGQGTSNFVVFPGNEGLLTILERNGKPIPR